MGRTMGNTKKADPICVDIRPCFAKNKLTHKCGILEPNKDGLSGYVDGECPFCKPKREVTNGIEYPFDPYYVPSGLENAR